MIYKSSSPLSPAVTIRISGVEVDYSSISGADLVLEENMHDLLVLKFVGVPPSLINQYLNAPVMFVIDSGVHRSQMFTGYVSSIEPTSQTNLGFVNQSPFQEVNVYCVGSSYYMKRTKTARWNPPTLSNVISTMSKLYGFSADYPSDKYRPVGLSQVSESDWALLTKIVNKYSYKVTIHGTHIHVWDTYNATGRAASYHELLTPRLVSGAQPCTILSFDATIGALSAYGHSSAISVAYLDNQGQSLKVASKDVNTESGLGKKVTSPFENFMSSSTQSFEDAQKELLRIKKSNMPFHAKVVVTAGAGIVPGGIVNVLNYGADFDGLWYVKGVKHSLVSSQYTTELELTKDALYTKTNNISTITKFSRPPDPILVNNKWVAATRRVREYN